VTPPWPTVDTLRKSASGSALPVKRASAATPAPVPASPSSTLNYGSVPTAEWTPPAERPIIRPPISGAGPQGRRMSSPAPVRAADELGVEESEFDKPTYLRRGLSAPE